MQQWFWGMAQMIELVGNDTEIIQYVQETREKIETWKAKRPNATFRDGYYNT